MSENKSVLSSDIPLVHPDQDEFDYGPFAQTIAKTIVNMSPSDGLVMSLNAPWGAGKSTVLNFITFYLRQYDPALQPIIVQFNPWWFTSREDLARQLINQMRASLGEKDFSDIKKKLGDFTEMVSSIPSIPGVSLGGVGKFLADKARNQSDIFSLKESIGKLLLEKDQKILIIIDDIDRLSTDEIRELFRIVKVAANFPNTIYLLAFDIGVVTNALEYNFVASGKDYLEKIVQVPFALPQPEKFPLRGFLFKKLNSILADTPDETFDKAEWANIFYEGIDHYIATPRDVNRLFNALRTTYPSLVGEVSPIDYIAVEVIRVFSPDFYEVIRGNGDELTGVYSSWGVQHQDISLRKEMFEKWLSLVPENERVGLRKLMIRLFPRFAGVYGGTNYAPDYAQIWQRQLRVCSPEHFLTYFRFSISQDSISNLEINATLKKTPDAEAFGAELIKYSDQHRRDGTTRLRVLLERLQAYTDDLPVNDIPSVIGSFFNVGDKLLKKEDEVRGFFDIGNEINIMRIIYQLLIRVPQDERFSILKNAVENGSSISIIEMIVTVSGQEHGKFGGEIRKHESDRKVSGEQLRDLEEAALNKIRDAGEQGTLLLTPNLKEVLHRWEAWSNSIEVRAWVDKTIVTDENLAKFIYCFSNVQRSQSFGEVALREKFRLDPDSLKPFTDPDILYPRIRDLHKLVGISDEHKKAAEQFCAEYEMRQKGENPNARF